MWPEGRTHTPHNPSYGGSATGIVEEEDVVVVVVGPEPGGQTAGQRYNEVAGRRMDGDRRMIRKPGSEVVAEIR